MYRVPVIVTASLLLSGCSLSVFDLPSEPGPAQDDPESYYRQLVLTTRDISTFQAADKTAQLYIAPLRRSVAPQPGDWTTCVSATLKGEQKYIAFFFRNRDVIAARSDVVIDRCSEQQYVVLPSAEELAGAPRSVATRTNAPARPRMPGIY